MNPIDPRRSERHLLAAVHRWARTNGWQRYRGLVFGWQNGDDATASTLQIGTSNAITANLGAPVSRNANR